MTATCPKGGHQQQYPLYQPVVSGLDPPACHVYNNMLCVEKGVNRMPGPSNGTDQQIAGKGSGVDSTQGNTQGQGTSGLLCVDEVRTEATHKALGAHCVRNDVLPYKEYAGQVAELNKQEYCSAATGVNDQLRLDLGTKQEIVPKGLREQCKR